MFCHYVSPKIFNIVMFTVIHVHVIAVSIYCATICLLSMCDCSPVCNYSHIFLCFVVTQLLALSLLDIIHVL